ncbi:MAG: hypothetical protein IPG85_14755 [Bacteroidetes bacterium]|nr:hypothetical protein [Bacteroidota bacterium]
MKKLIITAIVLLTAHFSYAQVALGLSLGFSSSKAKVSYLEDDGYISMPVNGIPVSFIADFGNKYVKFSTGFTFVKRGCWLEMNMAVVTMMKFRTISLMLNFH